MSRSGARRRKHGELPLYREVRAHPPQQDPQKPAGHTGLWFERAYDRYPLAFTDTKDNENAFHDWLRAFNHRAGEDGLLDAAIERQSQLVEDLGGHQPFSSPAGILSAAWVIRIRWKMALTRHPVWGVPYLPGSGLKGLVRAWVEAWAYNQADAAAVSARKARLQRWFGSVSKEAEREADAASGEVIFFDALPVQPVSLVTDIMTPHRGNGMRRAGTSMMSTGNRPRCLLTGTAPTRVIS
ncbi:MAG: RAMP superfamily CRISPR-associated protein [Thiolinea sp.]